MRLVRHRQTKEPATDRLHLNHRVTPRLHTSSSFVVVASVVLAPTSQELHKQYGEPNLERFLAESAFMARYKAANPDEQAALLAENFGLMK